MRPDSLVVTMVLLVVIALILGSLAVLATETAAETRSLVAVGLLVAVLVGAVALGARSRRRLANPYW